MKIWVTRDEKGWMRDSLIGWTIRPRLIDGKFEGGQNYGTGYIGIIDDKDKADFAYFKKDFKKKPPRIGECKRFLVISRNVLRWMNRREDEDSHPQDTSGDCFFDLAPRYSD